MSVDDNRLVFVCLNPAWQRSVVFEHFALTQVNRAVCVSETGGGKGVNAARAARVMRARASVALFSGGSTGGHLRAELDASGIACIDVPVAPATRVCTTIIDRGSGQVTEMIEPSGAVSAGELGELSGRLLAELSSFSGLGICGTYPPGVPDDFYGQLAGAASASGATVLLDGVRGIGPALHQGIDILRLNADELRQVTGEDDLGRALHHPSVSRGSSWLAVTDGPQSAWLVGHGQQIEFALPVLSDIRGTIGGGDCASAIMLMHTAGRELTPEVVAEAFAQGLAAASASCLTDVPALFRPHDAASIRTRMTIKHGLQ